MSKPDPVQITFDGPLCRQEGAWEVDFGGQRVSASFARVSNNSVQLTATPPTVPSPTTVDVKIVYNSQPLHVSPQSIFYYSPYALDNVSIQSSTSFLIQGRNFPVLPTKPVVILRVYLSTALSPHMFLLLVETHDAHAVRIPMLHLSPCFYSFTRVDSMQAPGTRETGNTGAAS
jgi:hypothetical protein